MSRVSVVIPTYNCAPYLPAAIESVLGQTYPDLEIVVVDDGSTDDTPGAIAPYLGRLRYIRQENRGLPGARNTGIRASSAEFVALLDADDEWVPRKLELQMPGLNDPEVGIVYSDFSVRYSDGQFRESYLAERPLAGDGYVLESYVQSRFLFPSTMVMRRTCLETCGLFDEEMVACEDIELFARICLRWKVLLVRDVLMIRNEGSHNLTGNSEKMSRYTILAFEKILAKEPDLPGGVRRVIHQELGRQHWWRGSAAFDRGDFQSARQSFRRSVEYDGARRRRAIPLLAATYLPAGAVQWLRARKRS